MRADAPENPHKHPVHRGCCADEACRERRHDVRDETRCAFSPRASSRMHPRSAHLRCVAQHTRRLPAAHNRRCIAHCPRLPRALPTPPRCVQPVDRPVACAVIEALATLEVQDRGPAHYHLLLWSTTPTSSCTRPTCCASIAATLTWKSMRSSAASSTSAPSDVVRLNWGCVWRAEADDTLH